MNFFDTLKSYSRDKIDDDGEYKFVKKGSYGEIWTSKKNAIKKIPLREYDTNFLLNELKILCYLKKIQKKLRKEGIKWSKTNLITMKKIIKPKNVFLVDNAYIMFEKMHLNLNQYLYLFTKFRISSKDVKFITYNILNGLHNLHKMGIMHRDLVPANILLHKNGSIKITDFGLSCSISSNPEYANVTTLPYRAPEILENCFENYCSRASYTEKIDIWSLGVIFGSLLIGKNLFDEKLISAKRNQTEHMKYRHKIFIHAIHKTQIEKKHGADAYDLFVKLLQIDPTKRPSTDEILKHKYFERFYKDHVEIDIPYKFTFNPYLFEDNELYNMAYDILL